MSFLPLVNEVFLAKRPHAMPMVLILLEQQRISEAVQLLQQHTLLPRSDIEDFVTHHLRAGVLSAERVSGKLLSDVHQAMKMGDTNHARYLLRMQQGKAQNVELPKPKSLFNQLVNELLMELLIYVVMGLMVVAFVVMVFRSWTW